MPDNYNTENKQDQVSQKPDWTQKGFGWVPDYPDIRDFFPIPSINPDKPELQKEVQKEGVSNSIDDLTEILAEAISSLNNRLQSKTDTRQGELEEIIEQLNDKAYGNIRFNAVKIYNVLIAATTDQKQKLEKQKDVIQFKKALYFLVKEKKFIPSDIELNKIFTCPNLEAKWLTEPDFIKEEELEKVIQDFQRTFNLRKDGVVGINTYLTLERCFSYRTLSRNEEDFLENVDQEKRNELLEVRKRHILDLKEGLKKLVQKGLLTGKLPEESEPEEFGARTEELVKNFQRKIGLEKNGKVRYSTFVKLNTCLANIELNDKATLSNHTCVSVDNVASTIPKDLPELVLNELSSKLDNPARLISISSLIPNDIFAILIDEFLLNNNELGNNNLLAKERFVSFEKEEIVIDPIRIKDWIKLKEKDIPQAIQDGLEEQAIQTIWKEQEIKITRIQLTDIIKNQFIIIDPIISVILIIMSPLAKKDDLKKTILDGINNFKKLFEEDNSTNYLKSLAQAAVEKSKKILDFEKGEALDQLKVFFLQIEKIFDELEKLADEADKLEKFISKASYNQTKQDITEESITEEIRKSYIDKKKEDVKARKRIVEVKKDYIIKMIQDSIISLIFQWLLEELLESLNKLLSVDSLDESTDFSKKEHFRLVADQENYIDKKYFGIYPAKNLSASQNDFKILGKGKQDYVETLQKLEFLECPEITLPISSSAFHRQNWSTSSKELYFLLPGAVDLSYWCSPIEDQGSLNTCTACAGVGLLEYFAKRSFGEFEDLSPLFLYKAARDLRRRSGDIGAPLRDIMRSMILFGVPPEQYWPYRPENVDKEPSALCYSYAQNYQTLKYFRLDRADISPNNLLLKVKAVLAAGFPCMFGFTAYTSIYGEDNVEKGYIPFPNPDRDRVTGGHAVVAVGYNDYIRLPHPEDPNGRAGALLIRNSWGREWGLGGYGWLSYDYVLKGLTGDWWSLLKAEWFGRGYFGLDAREPGGLDPYGPRT